MADTDVFLTKEGIDELQKELQYRIEKLRPEILNMLQSAREQGDLSENADYTTSKDEQGKNEGRIEEIKKILSQVKVINSVSDKKNGNKVMIGSKVTIQYEASKKDETFDIVGEIEAEPELNKISNKSPFAMAIIGKSVGDTVRIINVEKPYIVKIVKVEN